MTGVDANGARHKVAMLVPPRMVVRRVVVEGGCAQPKVVVVALVNKHRLSSSIRSTETSLCSFPSTRSTIATDSWRTATAHACRNIKHIQTVFVIVAQVTGNTACELRYEWCATCCSLWRQSLFTLPFHVTPYQYRINLNHHSHLTHCQYHPSTKHYATSPPPQAPIFAGWAVYPVRVGHDRRPVVAKTAFVVPALDVRAPVCVGLK